MLEITNTSIKTFQNCPRKYFYSYQLLLKSLEEKKALTLGKQLHQAIEYYYTHKVMNQEYIDTLPESKETAMLRGMLAGYAEKYSPDEFMTYEPEKVFSIDLPNLDAKVKGRKDAVVTDSDGTNVLEIKTTSLDIESFKEQVDWDIQPLLYMWAHYMETDEITDGVLYRVIKKPQIRLKKSETELEFYARVTEEYKDLDKYFHSFKVHKTCDDVGWFQDELMHHAEEMSRKRNFWPRNLQRCFDYYSVCDFLPLCQNKELDEGTISSCYAKKTTQHEELEDADN